MNVEREQAAVDSLRAFILRIERQPWREVGRSELALCRLELQRLDDLVDHCRRPWWLRVLAGIGRAWSRLRALLPVALLVVAAAGCRAPGKAVKVLEAGGYSSVKLTGAAVGCCYDRPIGDGFEAIGPDGQSVRGCVCRYYWGSPIIRTK